MFKVLLADDENWVVESLKVNTNWHENGFEVIGTAFNGIEALNLIRELKPDLVFTDIRMPGLSGLELIKKSGEEGIETLFVVASGYAEFAYAQKAINYGAMGYCLKPFDENEINGILIKARQLLESKISVLKQVAENIFDDNGNIDNGKIRLFLEQSDIDINKEGIEIAVSIGKGTPDLAGGNCLIAPMGPQKWIYIIKNGIFDESRMNIENAEYKNIKGIGVSRKITDMSEIQNGLDEAILTAYSFFITGRKSIGRYKIPDLMKLRTNIRQLDEAVKNRDKDSVKNCFTEFRHMFKSGSFSIRQVNYTYNMAMSFIYRFVDGSEKPFTDSYDQLLYLFRDVDEMLEYLEASVLNNININTTGIVPEIENKTMKEILKFVNKNFSQDISIQSIAMKFYVNPSYVSQLFKKEVGLNYTEYLTKMRIDFACGLLRESRLSVNQISEKAGYNDYFYFTRIFKKITGKTPSEFRNNIN